MLIMSGEYEKLSVVNLTTGKEIAVITDDRITTAHETIVVKLTPKAD